MTEESLKYMSDVFDSLDIPYSFMEWRSVPVPNTYWTGEYNESESLNEDGQEESTFILTGTTNQTYLELERVKEQIKERFPIYGETEIMESGSGIAIMYAGSYPIPSVDIGVHRIQINLKIYEWRV